MAFNELDSEPDQLLEVNQAPLLEFVFVPAGDLGDFRTSGKQTITASRSPRNSAEATVQARQRSGGEWLLVRRHGILVRMVRTVPELARIVDLADISEALPCVSRLAFAR